MFAIYSLVGVLKCYLRSYLNICSEELHITIVEDNLCDRLLEVRYCLERKGVCSFLSVFRLTA